MNPCPKPKVRKKSERTRQTKELDGLLAKYIKTRAKWTCEMCGKQWASDGSSQTNNRLTSAHVKTKGRYGLIRFEPDNLMALCWLPCHESKWHKDPADAMRWFREKWPGRIERIEIAAACAPKLDLKLLLTVWRDKVKKL